MNTQNGVGGADIPKAAQFKDMDTYMAFLHQLLNTERARRVDYLRSIPHLDWAGLKYQDLMDMASLGMDNELGFRIIGEEEESLGLFAGDPDFYMGGRGFREENLRACLDAVSHSPVKGI